MELLDYQKRLLDENYQDSQALFMDMGTGKTYVAAESYLISGCSKLLVVCLTTKIDDWFDLLANDIGLDCVRLDKGTKRNRELIGDQCNIISFESSWRLADELLDWVDDETYIIVDESHKIKNRKSKLGKFMRKLGKKTRYKSILTGTPQSNGYEDYYNQLYFLGWTVSVKDFEKRFCVIGKEYYNGYPVRKIIGYKNTDELDAIINERAIYYERNAGYVPTESVVKTPHHRQYDRVRKSRIHMADDGRMHVYDSIGGLYTAMRQLASGYIEGEVFDTFKLEWIRDFLDSYQGRIVIFYNFNTERDLLLGVMHKAGRPVSEYNGRDKNLENFLENEDGVVLANYKSGSTGVNLFVKAEVEIMFSLPTSYIDFVQAKKRIDRLGQEGTPMFYYLIMKNTVDTAIYYSLKQGQDFDERMFENYMDEGAD